MPDDPKDGAKSFQTIPLDWAVIALLERVRSDVITPKLHKWGENMRSPECRDVQCRRLAAAFFFLEGKGIGFQLAEEDRTSLRDLLEGGFSGSNMEVLKRLLEHHGRLLFSAYYYVRTKMFGGGVFLPIIPGYFGRSSPTGSSWADDFIKQADLPFVTNPQYLDALLQFILPERVGVSSQYAHLLSHGAIRDNITNIPYFLGDLGVLSKGDDYVNCHLSALVAPFVDKVSELCFGAYVLTCGLPGAFDREDVERLERVVRGWSSKAPLKELHALSFPPDRGISVKIDVPDIPHLESALTPDALREASAHALGSLRECDCLAMFVLRKINFVAPVSMVSINSEAVYNALMGIFPGTPLLRPDQVCVPDDSVFRALGIKEMPEVIDPLKFLMLSSGLRRALSFRKSARNRTRALEMLLKHRLLPHGLMSLCALAGREGKLRRDTARQIQLVNVPTNTGDVTLAIFRKPPSDSKGRVAEKDQGKARRRLLNSITNALQRIFTWRQPIGAASPALSILQRKWNDAFVFGTADKPAADGDERQNTAGTGHQLALTLNGLFQELIASDQSIIGILLLQESDIYFPRLPDKFATAEEQNVQEIVDHSCRSFPVFWLFQQLNSLVNLSHWPVDAFEGKKLPAVESAWLCHPPESFDKGAWQPVMLLRLDDDAEENRRWISSFAYLGIPIVVAQEQPDTSTKAQCDLEVMVQAGRFEEAVRVYLRCLLRRAAEVQSLKRVFAPISEAFTVDSIEIESYRDSGIAYICAVSSKSMPLKTTKIRVRWRRSSTPIPLFCGIVTERLHECAFSAALQSVTKQANTETNAAALLLSRNGNWNFAAEAGAPECKAMLGLQDQVDDLVESVDSMQSLGAQDRIHVVVHEIKDTLGPLKRLIRHLERNKLGQSSGGEYGEKWQTEINALTQKASPSLHMIELAVAIEARKKSVEADLLGKQDFNLDKAIRELIKIAVPMGVDLAEDRFRENIVHHLKDRENWNSRLVDLATDSLSLIDIDAQNIPFWRLNDKDHFDNRLGFECLLVTALANSIQHLVKNSIVDNTDSFESDEEERHIECFNPLFRETGDSDALKIKLTPTQLIVVNRVSKKAKREAQYGASQTGTYRTLHRCVERTNFAYADAGQVTKFDFLGDEFITEVALPQPFTPANIKNL